MVLSGGSRGFLHVGGIPGPDGPYFSELASRPASSLRANCLWDEGCGGAIWEVELGANWHLLSETVPAVYWRGVRKADKRPSFSRPRPLHTHTSLPVGLSSYSLRTQLRSKPRTHSVKDSVRSAGSRSPVGHCRAGWHHWKLPQALSEVPMAAYHSSTVCCPPGNPRCFP